jgi:hypothetical protein
MVRARPSGAPPPIPVRFTDIAAAAGITFRHRHGGTGKKYFVENTGAGVCWFDYDNDGRPDLYLVQSGALPGSRAFGGAANRSALYHNLGGGRFEDVTDRAGVGNYRYGQGACAGDYDGDGYLDLYVTNYGQNRLYHNNGDGTFADVATRAGVASEGYHTSAAFADVDGDGRLDLYVARYVKYRIGSDPPCGTHGLRSYCPPVNFDGEPDVLFRNNGDGTFTDVTREAGLWEPRGKGLGVIFFDYNRDGRPDLFVSNDGSINRLYENLGGPIGHPRFRDVTGLAGVGTLENGTAAAAMGVDAGDYDGDGRLDLFVANFSAEPNSLWRNRGDGTFEDRSLASGLGPPSLPFSGFGAAFVDYDLDGYPDVMVANGHVDDNIGIVSPGITYAEPNSLYRNTGGGHFRDVSNTVGPDFTRRTVSRGLALADFDGDGDVDVCITNNDGACNLFRNDGGNRRRWLQLRLRAARGDPFAVGARVTVEAGGRRQVREVRTGTSYASQHDLTLVFGLNDAPRADRVVVRWPWRGEQEWRNLTADRLYVLREGEPMPPGR